MKIPKKDIENELIESGRWPGLDSDWAAFDEDLDLDVYYHDYEDNRELSWMWYLEADELQVNEGWKYVVHHPMHKNATVGHWIEETFPGAEFKYERNHFLIKDAEVATMVTLKFT